MPRRALLGVLLRSMRSMLAIATLLLLAALNWALAGVALFGGVQLDPPYPNFNSFPDSLALVFQVLTTEGE